MFVRSTLQQGSLGQAALPSRRRSVLAAGLAVLVLCGCQQQSVASSAPSAGGSTGFRAAYAELQATHLARTGEIQRQAAQAKSGDLKRTLEVYEAIRTSTEQASAELRALRAPTPVQPALTQALQLMAEQSDQLDALIEAGKANDTAGVSRAIQRLTALTGRSAAAASQLERALTACGTACD